MPESIADLRERAKALLAEGGFTCVAFEATSALHTSRERGVRPLLALLDAGICLEGGAAADKVIGNGAANIYVLLRASAVHGLVMSESAHATLRAHGIAASADAFVSHIVNRTGDGFCPMEQAVEGIAEPMEAVAAVRRRMAELAETGRGGFAVSETVSSGSSSAAGSSDTPEAPEAPSAAAASESAAAEAAFVTEVDALGADALGAAAFGAAPASACASSSAAAPVAPPSAVAAPSPAAPSAAAQSAPVPAPAPVPQDA